MGLHRASDGEAGDEEDKRVKGDLIHSPLERAMPHRGGGEIKNSSVHTPNHILLSVNVSDAEMVLVFCRSQHLITGSCSLLIDCGCDVCGAINVAKFLLFRGAWVAIRS